MISLLCALMMGQNVQEIGDNSNQITITVTVTISPSNNPAPIPTPNPIILNRTRSASYPQIYGGRPLYYQAPIQYEHPQLVWTPYGYQYR